MSQLLNFRGASTAGLFIYLVIYAGMLGYATVAFDKTPELQTVQLSQPIENSNANESSVIEEKTVSVVTLAKATGDESIPASEAQQVTPELMQPVVTDIDVTTENMASVAKAGKLIPVQQESVVAHSDLTVETDSLNAQLASVYAQQLRSAHDHGHYYNAASRANGRSRGAINGDGDFSFSMKFKSRAKMNADADSSLQNAYYANQYMNYWRQQGAQPVYQYYYR